MSDEQQFLNAIVANPDDQTTKLVYADWLDERDDPRADIVRLKVRLASCLHDNLELVEDRKRMAELEATVSARWLVLLDGPVWCLSGNVVATRPFGPQGAEIR